MLPGVSYTHMFRPNVKDHGVEALAFSPNVHVPPEYNELLVRAKEIDLEVDEDDDERNGGAEVERDDLGGKDKDKEKDKENKSESKNKNAEEILKDLRRRRKRRQYLKTISSGFNTMYPAADGDAMFGGLRGPRPQAPELTCSTTGDQVLITTNMFFPLDPDDGEFQPKFAVERMKCYHIQKDLEQFKCAAKEYTCRAGK